MQAHALANKSGQTHPLSIDQMLALHMTPEQAKMWNDLKLQQEAANQLQQGGEMPQ